MENVADYSLRKKINRVTLQVTVGVAIITLLGIAAYWALSHRFAQREAASFLKENIEQQKNTLLPLFLVPEQKAALDLVLKRIKDKENLSSIQFLDTVPEEHLSDCGPLKNCSTYKNGVMSVYAPVSVDEENFGYLVKSIETNSLFSGKDLMWVLIFTLLVLFVLMLMLLHLFKKITANEIPRSLNNLVIWVEAWLKGNQNAEKPELHFSELDELASKITEVYNIHEKERNQAIIGQISSGIIHDIKNELQSIRVAQELASEEVTREKKLKRLENLNSVISKRLPNLLNIVDTTLDLNRNINLNQRFSDLNKTLSEVVNDFQPRSNDEGVKLSFNKSSNPVVAFYDPTQLGRVFRNLLENSFQALFGKNSKKINVALSQNDSEVSIAIEDSGPGVQISETKLFQAFESSKKNGTGLGLFNSRKIVAAHGGKIKASKSVSLKGARFEILLPLGGYSD